MRRVIFSMNTSLDGYISGLNDELDWSEPNEELHRYFNAEQRETGTYLFGRRMYELMADFWETADELPDVPEYIKEFSRDWREVEKVVFSRTLEEVGPNARLVREVVAEEVAALKAQPGKDLAVAGPTLAETFINLDLIDEYRLHVHPVVLGEGKPMLRVSGEPLRLRLVETRPLAAGVVRMCFHRVHDA